MGLPAAKTVPTASRPATVIGLFLSASEAAENFTVVVKSSTTTDKGNIPPGETTGEAVSNGQILSFATGTNSASEKVRITSGGSVNIGGDYTQTSKKFKVTGNSTFDGGLHVTGLLEGGSGFSIINGNLTLPAYTYHDADSDTYYGFSGANQYSVFTGGSERVRIDSDGHLSSVSYTHLRAHET